MHLFFQKHPLNFREQGDGVDFLFRGFLIRITTDVKKCGVKCNVVYEGAHVLDMYWMSDANDIHVCAHYKRKFILCAFKRIGWFLGFYVCVIGRCYLKI